MMKNEVLMTGLGVVTPIGSTKREFWSGILQGRSGLRTEDGIDVSDLPCGWVSGVIDEHDRDTIDKAWGSAHRTWGDRIMLSAIFEAVEDARLAKILPERVGFIWAQSCPSSGSSPSEYERFRQEQVELYNAAGDSAAEIIKFLDAKYGSMSERNYTFASDVARQLDRVLVPTRVEATCSGGLRAIIEGVRLIQSGEVEVAVVAAGVARRNHYVYSQYAQLTAMSHWKGSPQQASMPFDIRRSGMVISEAAGAIILEAASHVRRRNDVQPYCTLGGWGLAVGTEHVTAPRAYLVEQVIEEALKNSGVSKDEIDAVSVHGTSTKLNDLTEAAALEKIFGSRIKDIEILALKALTGHASAASGVIEVISSALSLTAGIVPTVPTCVEKDPKCRVNIRKEVANKRLRNIMKDSFGFGGQYASMVMKYTDGSRRIDVSAM